MPASNNGVKNTRYQATNSDPYAVTTNETMPTISTNIGFEGVFRQWVREGDPGKIQLIPQWKSQS